MLAWSFQNASSARPVPVTASTMYPARRTAVVISAHPCTMFHRIVDPNPPACSGSQTCTRPRWARSPAVAPIRSPRMDGATTAPGASITIPAAAWVLPSCGAAIIKISDSRCAYTRHRHSHPWPQPRKAAYCRHDPNRRAARDSDGRA